MAGMGGEAIDIVSKAWVIVICTGHSLTERDFSKGIQKLAQLRHVERIQLHTITIPTYRACISLQSRPLTSTYDLT